MKLHKFRGIDKVTQMLNKYKDNILVYFDPDVDGMISGYFVCKYLTMSGIKFQWYVNSNRSHDWGLDIDKLKNMNIIAVDFKIKSSTIKKIVKAGNNIISMDHHVNQDAFIISNVGDKSGVVVNNQYPFEEEDGRYLSGAGVVFETLSQINDSFNTEENRALVGLTLLSDIRDIENPLAKEYLTTLYNHKYKGYIKYLIDMALGDKDFGFGVPRMDRKFVDYSFSPKINSNLRFNREEDVVKFFLGSGKLDVSYHGRQKKLVKEMLEYASIREFSNLRVVFIKDWEVMTDEDQDVLSNFIGLIASKFLNGKQSVIAYLISTDEVGKPYVKRASFRGNINSLDYLTEFNKYIHCEGHNSAFGIINLIPSKELFINLNNICNKIDGNSTYQLDITPISNMSIFAHRNAKKMAEFNMYCLSSHSKYVRYTGNNIRETRRGDNYIKYLVDGEEVIAFDTKVDFSNGLIYPILERNYIYYYLQSEIIG